MVYLEYVDVHYLQILGRKFGQLLSWQPECFLLIQNLYSTCCSWVINFAVEVRLSAADFHSLACAAGGENTKKDGKRAVV